MTMGNTDLSNPARSFGISLAIACIANALLVAAKEKNPKVLAMMKGLTGHHWITHCTVIILLFLLLGWVLSKMNGGQGIKLSASALIGTVVGGVVVSGLIIVGFYLIEG